MRLSVLPFSFVFLKIDYLYEMSHVILKFILSDINIATSISDAYHFPPFIFNSTVLIFKMSLL